MQSQNVFLQTIIRDLVTNGGAPAIRFFKLTWRVTSCMID